MPVLSDELLMELRKNSSESVYNDIIHEEFDYLSGRDKDFGFYQIYESFIFFLIMEEYEKCAVLRRELDNYFSDKKYFIPN